MNKYLLLILVLLLIGIFAFESQNSEILAIGSSHFDNGGISFDYPIEWNITNGSGPLIGSYEDPNGLDIEVYKLGLPAGYDLSKHVQLDAAGKIDKNFQLVSQKNTTINGTTAYEMDYTINGEKQRKEVWVQKNNLLYSIILTAPNGTTVNLDSLVKSIKVNDSTDSPVYRDWARIDLPQFKQEWIMDSYSLNDVNAVKHLSSFYPGEKGQMALVGHHTTHSAPFRYIDQLKPGNKVIIKDKLTQKEYTYEVVSNGNDIRWGVEAEDIKYQTSDNPELWLITCWPPGYSRAAYIVHCKLDSVEPLT
ncbi:MAG: sortase domain-containing protein [Methanobacterium sp.]